MVRGKWLTAYMWACYINRNHPLLDASLVDAEMLRPVLALCENILPYSNEGMSVVRPSSVSLMFSLQLIHIAPWFRLLQRFYWYKVYKLLTSYVEKCWSHYWCVTWFKNPSPANCRLVLPIVVRQVHQNRKRRGLMHI